MLVSRKNGTEKYFYQYNGHTDVTALSDTSGEIVATYYYDEFGNIKSSTGSISNPYKYAGYEYESALGYYNLKARYYDPQIGRFISKDPYWTVDNMIYNGRETPNFPAIMQSANLYVYALNNPVKYNDKTGELIGALIVFGALLIGTATLSRCEPSVSNDEFYSNAKKAGNVIETSPYNFSGTAFNHLNGDRYVPMSFFVEVINNSAPYPDPQGTAANMYYSTIYVNGKLYNFEVLYNSENNTIQHYEYTQNALGPLGKIKK